MKLVTTQLSYFLRDPDARSNLRALWRLVAVSLVIVVVFAVLFHLIMGYEGQQHSWLTGLYWTLTVMSTLGFGDITFTSDLGRAYSIVVLLTGIVLLLIVLPFAFIRFFYAPWLEARIHLRAPRAVDPGTAGHVVLCEYDAVGRALVPRLVEHGRPYVVIETDPARAAEWHTDGVAVALGDPDDDDFLRGLRVGQARLVFANREDTVNTSIALAVREVAPEVPVLAVAEREESVDVLRLSGATEVLPLKRWLGEQLAARVDTVHAQTHVVGRYHDLLLAELPVRRTPLAGKTVRETRLREHLGVSVVGVWERGQLRVARPDTPLSDASVAVVSGTRAQLDALDDVLVIYDFNPNPVLVIGAGKVGCAAAQALLEKEVPVHLVERDPALVPRLDGGARVFEGDAADYALLKEAGIEGAPAVVLTTHDDPMNIYLAAYCRRLNPSVRIVSRITYERNVEAVHRAGADFALSYTALGVAAVMARLDERELAVIGGGFDIATLPLPRRLAGKTLAESEIGARTGLLVLAIQHDGTFLTNPPAATRLEQGATLVVLGDDAQRRRFAEVYG
jgi:Trk K+ transport system NAD-binding subunit